MKMDTPKADNTMGDISNIIGSVAKIAPFLSQGGGVIPSPYPQYFADGGGLDAAYPYSQEDYHRLSPLWYPRTPSREAREAASPQDRATAAQIKYDSAGLAPGSTPSAFVGNEGGAPIPTRPYAGGGRTRYADGGGDESFNDRYNYDLGELGKNLVREDRGTRINVPPETVPLPQPRPQEADTINPDAPYRMPPREDVEAMRQSYANTTDAPTRSPTRVTINPDEAPAPQKSSNPYADLSPAAAGISRQNREEMMQRPQVDLPYGDLNHRNDTSRELARNPWMALVSAGFGHDGRYVALCWRQHRQGRPRGCQNP